MPDPAVEENDERSADVDDPETDVAVPLGAAPPLSRSGISTTQVDTVFRRAAATLLGPSTGRGSTVGRVAAGRIGTGSTMRLGLGTGVGLTAGLSATCGIASGINTA